MDLQVLSLSSKVTTAILLLLQLHLFHDGFHLSETRKAFLAIYLGAQSFLPRRKKGENGCCSRQALLCARLYFQLLLLRLEGSHHSLTSSHMLPEGRLEQKCPRHGQAAGKQARVATHRGLQAELLTAAASHLQLS